MCGKSHAETLLVMKTSNYLVIDAFPLGTNIAVGLGIRDISAAYPVGGRHTLYLGLRWIMSVSLFPLLIPHQARYQGKVMKKA